MTSVPPEFVRGSRGLATVSGVDATSAAVRQLLGTVSGSVSAPGELRWDHGYGTRIDQLRFEPNNQALVEIIRHEIGQAFSVSMPSLVLVDVSVTARGDTVEVLVNWRSRTDVGETIVRV